MSKGQQNQKLVRMILASIFMAILIVMTLIPNTGYISTGIVEITTLHIIVILGACILGPAYGALLGGFWGVTCMIRAFTNPLWILFTNPLISVVPRILVGWFAALVFRGLSKTKCPETVSLIIAAVTVTLTNTVFVIGSMALFGKTMDFYMNAYKMVSSILSTIIGVNGVIELAAAVVLVPAVYKASKKEMLKYKIVQENTKKISE